jgi:hypothetical protein
LISPTDDQPQPSAPSHGAIRLPLASLVGLAFCALGLGIRLHRLGAESLWYDETVSAHLAALTPAQTIARTALDIHPPGYYLALGLWTDLAGTSEFSLAFFSCIFGVTLIALTGALARRVGGVRASALATGLAALSAYSVWYAQEVRMYTLAAVLLCLLALVTMRVAEAARPRGWWLLWGATAAASLYTLYYSLFLLPVLSLYWLLQARAQRPDRAGAIRRWLGGHLVMALLYLPWLPIAVRQALDPPVPPWRSPLPWLESLRQGSIALTFGEAAPPDWWPLAVALVLVALLAPALGATRKPQARLTMAGFAAPWLLIVLVSFVQPLFHPRYLFPFSPFLLASLASATALPGRRWLPASVAVGVAFLAGNLASLDRAWTLPEFRADDLRGAVGELADRWLPGDVVFANAGYTYTTLEYYWPDPGILVQRVTDYADAQAASGPVILQGGSLGADPGLGWGHPDSDFYATTPGEMTAGLQRALAANRRLWVFRLYDTVTDPSGALRSWLDDTLVQTADIPIAGPSYGRLQAFVPALIDLPCTDPLDWEGHVATCAEVGAPERGRVPVYLHAQRLPASGEQIVHYTLRLSDASGATRAQTDGALVLDAPSRQSPLVILNPLGLRLPDDAEPGEYTVLLGLYSLPEGELRTFQPTLDGTPLEAPDGLVEVGRITLP